MATVAQKPRTERRVDPVAGVIAWHDSRRMRRALRRGSAGVLAGSGVREIFYRAEDWRLDRQARSYTRAHRGRARRFAAFALLGLIAVALVGAVALGAGGGSSRAASAQRAASVVHGSVTHEMAGVQSAVSVALKGQAGTLVTARRHALALRHKHALALRHKRAAALHRKRVAALKARRKRAAAHHAPAAHAAPKAAAPTPKPVYHAPAPRPVYHAPAPKPAPKPKPKGQSFDNAG